MVHFLAICFHWHGAGRIIFRKTKKSSIDALKQEVGQIQTRVREMNSWKPTTNSFSINFEVDQFSKLPEEKVQFFFYVFCYEFFTLMFTTILSSSSVPTLWDSEGDDEKNDWSIGSSTNDDEEDNISKEDDLE
jgi:hypothetical protein